MKLIPVSFDPFVKAKVAKSSVSYSRGMKSSHCGICEFYSNHACSKVAGAIDPAYWCRLFVRKRKGFAEGGAPEMTAPFPEAPGGYPFFTADSASDTPSGVLPSELPPVDVPPAERGPIAGFLDQLATPSKYAMEPDLQQTQTGATEGPKGVAPQNLGINDAGQYVDMGTGEPIPEEPQTRRPNVLPLTIDPSGKPELAMPKVLDVASNIIGGNVPGGAGTVLGSGFARGSVFKGLNKFSIPSKGTDVLGRDIPNWSGADVYHFTDKDIVPSISKEGYKTGSGYYGDMVSFTSDPLYADQFGNAATTAKISQDAKILNLNDPNDWNTFQQITKNYAPDKIPSALRANGYDGLYDAGAGDLFIANPKAVKFTGAVDPKTGKSIGNIPQEPKPNELGFYSATQHAIETAPQAKASPQQWMGMLRNAPGVKQEEMKWLGLEDWLKDQKGPVSKEQVADFVKANNIEIKEVKKGGPSNTYDEVVALAKSNPEQLKTQLTKVGTTPQDAERRVQGILNGDHYTTMNTAEYLRSYGDKSQTKFSSYTLPGGPLSRDTEILTNIGWRRMDEIAVGDIVMTRRDEDGELEWCPVECVPKVFSKELYHFKNQSIDMMVTADHRMVVKRRRRSSSGIFRTTAAELWGMSECLVPLIGKWSGTDSPMLFGLCAKDVAEFVGWYIAEGSAQKSRWSGKKTTLQIAQCKKSNPSKCLRLEALFNRLNLRWKYYGECYGVGIKGMNPELKELLHAQPLSDGKYIPDIFFTQGSRVIEALLTGLILGDGTTVKATKIRLARTFYFTKSKRLAGDVQALVLLTGRRASVRQRPSGLYVVGINTKQWAGIDDAKHAIVPYNDTAFCVTVKNHAIYVRRNGTAAFTGNSDYRELLLTLPSANDKYIKLVDEMKAKYGDLPLGQMPMTEYERAAIDKQIEAFGDDGGKFKSSHWDEPNVLAHVRFNDRVIDGKKTLFVEEVQSDWHQKGKRSGYDVPDKESLTDLPQGYKVAEHSPLRGESGPTYSIYGPDGNQIIGNRSNRQSAINEVVNELNRERRESRGLSGSPVPDAPFKTTWPELSMKRVLKYAADNGYDKVAWTPGDVQAARYDLSKHIDSIKYTDNGDGTYRIMADKGKHNVFEEDKADPKRLSEIVGKDMADKITKGEGKHYEREGGKDTYELSGLDLKVGGEGMKGFYDQILPATVNKLVKKYGAKVEKKRLTAGTELPAEKRDIVDFQPVHAVDINPQMKKAISEQGFPQFSTGGSVKPRLTPVAHNPFEAHSAARRAMHGHKHT